MWWLNKMIEGPPLLPLLQVSAVLTLYAVCETQ